MNVLAINCGSTSLKFRLAGLDPVVGPKQTDIASGTINSIGSRAEIEFRSSTGSLHREARRVNGLREAATIALEWLAGAVLSGEIRIDAVGHRIVHGGPHFSHPVPIDETTLEEIQALAQLAPLHNAAALEAIDAVGGFLGQGVAAVATFDTLFHRQMPPRAAWYALPLELMQRHDIRRYGFHGLAHRSIVERYATVAERPTERTRLVTLQLGGGCSIAAVDGGRSIDTSMGFTPLEGLMMTTRSGDIDPSLPGFLVEHADMTAHDVAQLLNSGSGLLGLSGRSGDVRQLLAAEADGDSDSGLALEMFCYRVRKAIGAYLAALGGADAVVFAGGIGEHQPVMRGRICAGLDFCGLTIDPVRNAAAVEGTASIGTDDSPIQTWVIPSDEESIIIQDTVSTLSTRPGASS